MRERQRRLFSGHHPHQCAPSHNGSSTSSHEALSKLLVSNELLAELGDLGVVRPNEDTLKYAAKMAAREAKAGACGGRFKVSIFKMAQPEIYTLCSQP
jgi:hypothetical protein